MARHCFILLLCILSVSLPSHGLSQKDDLTRSWDKYRKCKRIEQERLKLHVKSAIALFENAHERIQCSICLAPNVTATDILWWKDKIQSNHTGRSFILEKVSPKDAGLYVCTSKGEAKMSLAVQVLTEKGELIKQVKLFSKPLPRKNMTVKTSLGQVEIYSDWSPWSSCSEKMNCSLVGMRRKYGPCMVNIKSLKNISDLWTSPLPCRSELMPKELRELAEIKRRPSEVLYGFCKVKCSKKNSGVVQVYDQKGALVDEVDNSKGIYSFYQGIPKLPPPVQRIRKFPYPGDKINLPCPGYLIDNSPVKWKVGDGIMYIGGSSRIKFTPLQNLLIESVHREDSKVYSCWQQQRLIGTIKIRVMEKRLTPFDTTWSVLIVIMSSAILLIALYRVYTKQL